MKHVATKFLMLLLLLFSSAPQVAAESGWVITTRLAGQAFGYSTNYMFADYNGGWLMDNADYGTIAKQFAVSNGVIYHIVPGYTVTNGNGEVHNSITATPSYNNTTYVFSAASGLDSGCAQWSAGQGITSDDSGNIIYAYSTNYVCKVGCIAVVKNSGEYGKIIDTSVRKEIALGVYTHALRAPNAEWLGGTGRTDFFYASGNIYDGTGYMWFTDGVEVVRITIENVDGTQTATKQDVYQIAGSGFVTPTDEYHESRIKPYGDNGFLLQNQTGVYDCKLINGVMQVQQVIRGTEYQLHASNIYNFHGNKVLVLDAWENNNYSGVRDGQLSLYNMNTDNIEGLSSASICYSFNAMTGTITGSDAGAIGVGNDVTFPVMAGSDNMNIDTWCEFELDPNQTQLHLYTYCQGVGYAKYTINAEKTVGDNPINNVEATRVLHSGNQDVLISWDDTEVENPETTKYTVYYRVCPYVFGEDGTNKDIDFDNFTAWRELGTTEAGVTEFTHSDVKYLNHGVEFYKRTYQYMIMPADGLAYPEGDYAEYITDWVSVSPQWAQYREYDGVANYDGYQKVELFWSYDNKGNQPTSYDVYRDDVKITPYPLQLFNFVDYDVSPGREHTYYIMANYDGMTIDGEPIEGGKSEEKVVLVAKRDEAKPVYQLDEIYNYEIGTSEGQLKPQTGFGNFTDANYYRQGVYYRGQWYIAQRSDENGTSGGIIKFDANNILTSGTKYKTLPSAMTVGLAIDEGGNIFIRNGSDSYAYSLTSCHLIRAGLKADGSVDWHRDYDSYYTADLSSMSFTDNIGETLTSLGRCDYYSMSGDAFSADGATLYVAPSTNNTIFRINLKADALAASLTASPIDAYSIVGTSTEGKEYGNGDENYGFVVDGRSDYVFNLRSQGYFNLGKTQDDPEGKQIPIYDSFARINQAGGCTLQYNGELFIATPMNQYSINTGNFYVGIGEREQISVVDGKAIYEGPEGANLGSIIPVAAVTQKEMSDGSYRNSNGVWMYAELGRMDGTSLWPGKILTIYTKDANDQDVATEVTITKENIHQYAECMYIYQYVPGIRFAKYRIAASNTFPTPEVTVKVFPVYKDAEGNEGYRDEYGNVSDEYVELDRFDGVVTFPLIQGYGTSGNDNAYEIEGYRLTLFDKYGNIVFPVNGQDNDGIVDGILNLPHVAGKESYTIPYSDLERTEDNSYTAEIVTVFKGASGYTEGNVHESVPVIAEDDNTYVPMAPNGKAIAYRSLEWGDWDADMGGKPSFDKDGNPYLPDENDAYWDVYQISMNVDEPDFSETGMNEPVSYYTIHVAKTTDGETWTDKFDLDADVESAWVRDVMLYVGKGGELDGVQADEFGYVDCGALYGGKIPGTYTFKSIEDSPKDYPDVYWFEKYFIMRGDEATDVVYKDVIPDLINDRKYYVVAHYAAGTPKKIQEVDPIEPASAKVMAVAASAEDGNSKIYAQRHAELTAAVEYENIPTGVEDIELTAKVSVYPIPATVSITIKSAEVIENVEIYSLAGVNVKAFECNGEQVMTVAVDDLAAGYYMLKVNDYAPIKFLKK